MPSLSKILLPVDFSERSVGAAYYAKLLACHFQSEVTLLHLLPQPGAEEALPDDTGTMLAAVYRDRRARVSAELDSFLAGELAGLPVRRVILEGDPAAGILEFAKRDAPGLIIMPTHGYGPFRRYLLGSNTAKVLHDAACPVWTGVHLEQAPSNGPLPLKRILCAVDLGPQSSQTLCWAAGLALEFDAGLSLVHATGPEPEPAEQPDGDEGAGIQGSIQASIREAAARELRRLRQFVNAEADLILEPGDPAKVICATAERIQADLLVIGRGSAAGVFGRLRTNAYAIIRMAPCPVVSV